MAKDIPVTLTLYVPKDGSTKLAEALERQYVGEKEDYSKRKWKTLTQTWYAKKGWPFSNVVRHGGTLILFDSSTGGEHEFFRRIPEGIDFDHNAHGIEQISRRGTHRRVLSVDEEGNIIVPAGKVKTILALAEDLTKTEVLDRLRALVEIPPPSYALGPFEHEAE